MIYQDELSTVNEADNMSPLLGNVLLPTHWLCINLTAKRTLLNKGGQLWVSSIDFIEKQRFAPVDPVWVVAGYQFNLIISPLN